MAISRVLLVANLGAAIAAAVNVDSRLQSLEAKVQAMSGDECNTHTCIATDDHPDGDDSLCCEGWSCCNDTYRVAPRPPGGGLGGVEPHICVEPGQPCP